MSTIIIITVPNSVTPPSPLASQKTKDTWVQAQLEAAATELADEIDPKTYPYSIQTT